MTFRKGLRLIIFFFFFLLTTVAEAQKVGVVLSGGGAGGVTHIGVLKALEEHGIPIDYIAGTSMGALIGGLYASGYSPEEIEQMFLSEEFHNWAYGKADSKYQFYFKQKEDDASWVTFKFSLDTLLEANLPTSYIDPFPIDYGLMELFAPANACTMGQFDSLFIPFRCVAADITNKKLEIFRSGDLATSIRASMSYPFYLSPVEINGKLYFDGGIYNNFPADLVCDEFKPDYIIGSNASANFPKPKKDNLLSQIKYMLAQNTMYEINCQKGTIIQAGGDVTVFDFSKNKAVVDSGYQSTLKKIEQIKADISRRVDKEDLKERRKEFRENMPNVSFTKVVMEGVNNADKKYISALLRIKKDTITLNRLESKLTSLSTDERIRSIYPTAVYQGKDKKYHLHLNIEKEKKIFLSFGGNLSNKPINQGFIGLQYNNVGRVALSLHGNGYFGQFYSSALGGARIDMLFSVPLYLKAQLVTNRWNYFESDNDILIDNNEPNFLINRESFAEMTLGIPIGYKGKFEVGSAFGGAKFEYYQDNNFTQFDTTDITKFNNYTTFFMYERNSLNRKQYASAGSQLVVKGRFIDGKEETIPGSTSENRTPIENDKSWYTLKVKYDKYFNRRGRFKFGTLLEGVYSDQPFFGNYVASLLNAPAFQPIPETKTLFQETYRAHQYLAGGLRFIYSFSERLDLRLEAFVIQPFQEINQDGERHAFYGPELTKRYYIGSATTVYHSPIGPLALSLNYYNENVDRLSVLAHFGFILFNNRMHH